MNTVTQEMCDLTPRKLTKEETEHPEQVFQEFFEYANLTQARWYMWEMFKAMITGTYSQLKKRERSNLVYFYEQIERLTEAAHLLQEKKA